MDNYTFSLVEYHKLFIIKKFYKVDSFDEAMKIFDNPKSIKEWVINIIDNYI